MLWDFIAICTLSIEEARIKLVRFIALDVMTYLICPTEAETIS